MLEFFLTANDNEKLVINRMDNNSYRELVQSLNREQMGCFLPLLLSVKNANKQLTLF